MAGNWASQGLPGPEEQTQARKDQFHRHLGYNAAPSGQKPDAIWLVVSAGRKLIGQVWTEERKILDSADIIGQKSSNSWS